MESSFMGMTTYIYSLIKEKVECEGWWWIDHPTHSGICGGVDHAIYITNRTSDQCSCTTTFICGCSITILVIATSIYI